MTALTRHALLLKTSKHMVINKLYSQCRVSFHVKKIDGLSLDSCSLLYLLPDEPCMGVAYSYKVRAPNVRTVAPMYVQAV